VRQEQTLQAGIRLAGREEARRRLRRGIEQDQEALRQSQGPPSTRPFGLAQGPSGQSEGKVPFDRLRANDSANIKAPWPRVWSIAAVVLILAGLGVVGRWLTLRPNQEEAIRNVQILSEKGTSAPAETLTQERGTAAKAEEQKKAAPAVGAPSSGANRPSAQEAAPSTARSGKNTLDRAERRRDDAGERKVAAEAGEGNEAPRAVDRTEGVRRGTDERTLTGGAGQLSGAQEPERQATAHLLPGGPEGSATTWGASSKAKDAAPAPSGARGAARKAGGQEEPISVTFREGADHKRLGAEGGDLPALVRRDSSGVHITLLLPRRDSTLSAGPARAVRVAADSVVIVTAGRRLGLRLPTR
ncbi:MAG TPA: hypothetical protein VF889_07725, partial [Bacteroidota bacterium]